MDFSLPQAYLLGLIVLLGTAAVLVARPLLRVRRDEAALARLLGLGVARTRRRGRGGARELGA